jgi:hypothetical protein
MQAMTEPNRHIFDASLPGNIRIDWDTLTALPVTQDMFRQRLYPASPKVLKHVLEARENMVRLFQTDCDCEFDMGVNYNLVGPLLNAMKSARVWDKPLVRPYVMPLAEPGPYAQRPASARAVEIGAHTPRPD